MAAAAPPVTAASSSCCVKASKPIWRLPLVGSFSSGSPPPLPPCAGGDPRGPGAWALVVLALLLALSSLVAERSWG